MICLRPFELMDALVSGDRSGELVTCTLEDMVHSWLDIELFGRSTRATRLSWQQARLIVYGSLL